MHLQDFVDFLILALGGLAAVGIAVALPWAIRDYIREDRERRTEKRDYLEAHRERPATLRSSREEAARQWVAERPWAQTVEAAGPTLQVVGLVMTLLFTVPFVWWLLAT